MNLDFSWGPNDSRPVSQDELLKSVAESGLIDSLKEWPGRHS